tara:strand:+ start:1447 stop:2451 length:1005 start_codon:yes stop_codon:yes gene_type:complete
MSEEETEPIITAVSDETEVLEELSSRIPTSDCDGGGGGEEVVEREGEISDKVVEENVNLPDTKIEGKEATSLLGKQLEHTETQDESVPADDNVAEKKESFVSSSVDPAVGSNLTASELVGTSGEKEHEDGAAKEDPVRDKGKEKLVQKLEQGIKDSVQDGEAKLPDFELDCLVGRGTFGKLWKVKQKGTENCFAMKILNKEQVVAQKMIEHTLLEREIMATVRHPYVCNLYYSFQTKSHLFFLIEYLSGGTLFYHLRERLCPFAQVNETYHRICWCGCLALLRLMNMTVMIECVKSLLSHLILSFFPRTKYCSMLPNCSVLLKLCMRMITYIET